MKNKIMIIGILVGLMLMVSACKIDQPKGEDLDVVKEDNTPIEYEYTEEGVIKPEIAQEVIYETTQQVIKAIAERNSKIISNFVHPDKGVRFTPYTNISIDRDIVFTKEEMINFFEDQEKYLWGYYDGRGNEIQLTPGQYYEEFVYTEDFIDPEEVGYNQILSSGNMLENQFEVYRDPIIVEYYFSGFNPEFGGIDWRSLRLVFEEYEGTWLLVGIIHNQWTI